MQELLKAMRETVPKEGVLEGGQGEDIFSSMFDEHIADVAARRSGGALANALVRQLAGPDAGDGAGKESQQPGGPVGAGQAAQPGQAPSIAPSLPDAVQLVMERIRQP